MYIQLTNAHHEFYDEPIIINSEFIVVAYAENLTDTLSVTCIHCPPHGTWRVKETLSEVRNMLAGLYIE